MRSRLFGGRAGRAIPVAAGFALVFGVYAVLAAHYARVGVMAPDESFYTLAAREVWEGRVPYRDFAYTQTPIMPYVNGLLLRAAGLGLDGHRLVNAVWGGLGLLVLAAALRRRLGSWEPALVAAFAAGASARWVSLQALAVWCGIAGFFLNVAAASVLWGGSRAPRVAVFAIAGTVSIGCRLSCAPVVAVLALPLILEAGRARAALGTLGIFVGVGAAAFLPFVIASPEGFLFGVWEYHMESGIERSWIPQLLQWWNIAPAAIVVCALGLFGAPGLVRRRLAPEAALLAAGVIGVVSPMIPESAWGVYIAAGIPIAAAGGVAAVWRAGGVSMTRFRHALWALPLVSWTLYPPPEVPEGVSTEIGEVADLVESEVGEGPLLTPATVLAVETGREVLPGTELGAFAAMAPEDAGLARRMHMTTLPDLTRSIEALEPAAIVSMNASGPWAIWNFRWALPSLETQPWEESKRLEETIAECYEVVWENTTLEVLVPRQR